LPYVSQNSMKKNSILHTLVLSLLLLISIVVANNMINGYSQEGDGDAQTDSEISSELGAEILTNETVLTNETAMLTDNQNDTSMLNFGQPSMEESDNLTDITEGNESIVTEESLLAEDNESLPITGQEQEIEEDSLSPENMTTEPETEELVSENMTTEPETEELVSENMTTEPETEMTQVTENASELLTEDDLGLSQAERTLSPEVNQQLETAATSTVGVTNATAAVENEQITNVQQVINNIAFAGVQGGGDVNQIVNQISQSVMNNPNGTVAISLKKLADAYSQGNIDEIDIAIKQIGTQIAQGQNIEQTLVQITNNVINNIKNIKITEENYDKIIVHPDTLDIDKKTITETITTIKKSKTVVDVPRVHIKFDSTERNLNLRILNTDDAKYEMPFSKKKGSFTLDDDEFRVKVIGGKGKIQAASVARMLDDGKLGDREFLDKDRRDGRVYFDLDEIERAKYLLEVYIKLSDGSVGTFARGSVTIVK
jgi:hypothetical protein